VQSELNLGHVTADSPVTGTGSLIACPPAESFGSRDADVAVSGGGSLVACADERSFGSVGATTPILSGMVPRAAACVVIFGRKVATTASLPGGDAVAAAADWRLRSLAACTVVNAGGVAVTCPDCLGDGSAEAELAVLDGILLEADASETSPGRVDFTEATLSGMVLVAAADVVRGCRLTATLAYACRPKSTMNSVENSLVNSPM
jgi:hypothetical protein